MCGRFGSLPWDRKDNQAFTRHRVGVLRTRLLEMSRSSPTPFVFLWALSGGTKDTATGGVQVHLHTVVFLWALSGGTKTGGIKDMGTGDVQVHLHTVCIHVGTDWGY